MTTGTPLYSLNGEQPPIVGCECTSFCLLQHQEHGEVADPANVAYFEFSGKWVRLYFDGNTIFWRSSDQPTVPVNHTDSSALVLVNLSEMPGVVGRNLASVEYWGASTEVGATLNFEEGSTLAFRHLADHDKTLFSAG